MNSLKFSYSVAKSNAELQLAHTVCDFASDDNLSEDDIKECEKEDPLHEDEDVPHPDLIGKKKKMENTRFGLWLEGFNKL